MSDRRERLLEAMGLGPVWRLRARDDRRADGQASPPVAGAVASDLARAPSNDHAATEPQRETEPQRGTETRWETETQKETGRRDVAHASGADLTASGALTEEAEDRAARIARLDWIGLQAAVAACRACPLARTRTNTVFGVGDEHASVMVIGEAPGAEEDARGEPFVGQAGRLLDNMLAALALARGGGVYIANVLKCRPPQNRNPEPFEVAQCAAHLERQIDLIAPRLILAMGRFAAQTLLGTDASIGSLRGRVHRYRNTPTIVTYHPAYLLRNLPDKAKAWEDLVLVRRTLKSLEAQIVAKQPQ